MLANTENRQDAVMGLRCAHAIVLFVVVMTFNYIFSRDSSRTQQPLDRRKNMSVRPSTSLSNGRGPDTRQDQESEKRYEKF